MTESFTQYDGKCVDEICLPSCGRHRCPEAPNQFVGTTTNRSAFGPISPDVMKAQFNQTDLSESSTEYKPSPFTGTTTQRAEFSAPNASAYRHEAVYTAEKEYEPSPFTGTTTSRSAYQGYGPDAFRKDYPLPADETDSGKFVPSPFTGTTTSRSAFGAISPEYLKKMWGNDNCVTAEEYVASPFVAGSEYRTQFTSAPQAFDWPEPCPLDCMVPYPTTTQCGKSHITWNSRDSKWRS